MQFHGSVGSWVPLLSTFRSGELSLQESSLWGTTVGKQAVSSQAQRQEACGLSGSSVDVDAGHLVSPLVSRWRWFSKDVPGSSLEIVVL